MPFKAFYNDWLDCSGMIAENGNPNIVNLDKDFFLNLKFDDQSLKQYRIDAAVKCAETLGDNPALCLSGGIDSQAMVLCWQEAGIKFDMIIGVFKDGLNKHDSDHAKMFCNSNNILYKELEIDIVKLLARENYSISEKYKSYSPHFNVHYKMVEILAEQGYTGACFGGVTPFKRNDEYGYNFFDMPFHFLKVQKILPIPMQGSFLSFYPELTWAIGLQTKDINHQVDMVSSSRYQQNKIDFLNHLRYIEKTKAYLKSNLNIIPQENKYTGFELVKEYFSKKCKDGWAFERQFREPIAKKFNLDRASYLFKIKPDVRSVINLIYLNNI